MPQVGAAIAAVVKPLMASTLGRLLAGVAINYGLSLLAQRRAERERAQPRGMQVAGLSSGEGRHLSFPLGRTVTSGHIEYVNSHSRRGSTPRADLVLVISVSDLPGVQLRRLIVDDRYSAIDWEDEQPQGFPILALKDGPRQNGWIRWYDGTQTAADPYLVASFGTRAERPWTADHVGHGTAYAVITLRTGQSERRLRNTPRFRFEVDGIPVYDPRADSTAGGDGPQRADDPTTWEPSENAAVLSYNVFRGIPTPEGELWGGGFDAEDLPLATWAAGMNVCDTEINGRPQFRAGLMVEYGDEPASVVEELLAAGLGQVAETGGVVTCRWGAPAPASYWFEDDDASISDPEEFSRGPGLAETVNALAVTYAAPARLWNPVALEPLVDAAAEAEDGRRLLQQMQFRAVWVRAQAAQLRRAYLRDARRLRTHRLVLPPDAQPVEALDTVRWTSARFGYNDKLFEVSAAIYLPDGCVALDLRERNPADHDPDIDDDLPEPPEVEPDPAPDPVVIEGWEVEGITLEGAGGQRRPAIRLRWDADEQQPGSLVVEHRRVLQSGTEDAEQAVFALDRGRGRIRALAATTYEVRARILTAGFATDWTVWETVTTPDVRLDFVDFDTPVTGSIRTLQAGDRDRADEIDEAAITALAAALDEWSARVGILTNVAAKVDRDGAVAAVTNTVAASYDDLAALAQATAFAEATADGIREGFLFRLGAGGLLELVAVADGTQGAETQFRVLADRILLDGSVAAQLIAAGAITADKLAAGEIITSAAQIGALTVGSIQLQEGAVTVTRATDVAEYILDPGAGWVTVASIAFTPFAPAGSLRCEALLSIDPDITFTNDFDVASLEARLRWRGDVIGPERVVARRGGMSSDPGDPPPREVVPAQAIVRQTVAAGAGEGTLQLQVRAQQCSGAITAISLDCQEFKR